jgi:pyrroline-5-carboxylate reductase
MLSEIKQIGFIGGGNMAGAIIGGLISAGYSPSNIVASDPYEPSRKKLEHDFQIATTTDNVKVVQDSEIVILAVKPQILDQVARGLVEVCRIKRPVFISIVAGITISDISQWLDPTGQSPPFVIRCMPNTPALVHQGAAGLYASDLVNAQQRQKAMAILASISPKAYWVDSEHLLDIVTGLSGSGPAYFFYIVEALVEAGVANGLELHVARGLAAQTCLGLKVLYRCRTNAHLEQ